MGSSGTGPRGVSGIEKPTSWFGRWVWSLSGNEPCGRHLYGFDHHHFRDANAFWLLIDDEFYQCTAGASTRRGCSGTLFDVTAAIYGAAF